MNTTFEATNSKSRVLIVDDNSRFARSAQLFLEQTGNYFACALNDPRRALETARSFKPDLVVVDLIMPQADGLEVATQLEADWALHEVPIGSCWASSFWSSGSTDFFTSSRCLRPAESRDSSSERCSFRNISWSSPGFR